MTIDLNEQWLFFLDKVGLKKEDISEDQYVEMRRAFMGGAAQLMVILSSKEFAAQSPAEMAACMDGIGQQITNFWAAATKGIDGSSYRQTRFTKESAMLFEKAYKSAVAEDSVSFLFEGNMYLTTYAKYMVEYLKTQKML
jgi:hypothetical protein